MLRYSTSQFHRSGARPPRRLCPLKSNHNLFEEDTRWNHKLFEEDKEEWMNVSTFTNKLAITSKSLRKTIRHQMYINRHYNSTCGHYWQHKQCIDEELISHIVSSKRVRTQFGHWPVHLFTFQGTKHEVIYIVFQQSCTLIPYIWDLHKVTHDIFII